MSAPEAAPTSRLSTDSDSSHPSDGSPPSSNDQPTAALIRVHDSQDDDSFDFSEGEDLQGNNSTPTVILTPSHVFVYILSPYLKLGTMLVLSSQAPLKVSLPALAVFATLSAFSRQIWFLLARYVGKADVGDVIAEALAKGRRKERLKALVKSVAHVFAGVERLLLATVYLKGMPSHKMRMLSIF